LFPYFYFFKSYSNCAINFVYSVLASLATDPDYRRRGAATALVQIPFQQADKEDHLIYLDTFEGGYQREMYLKFGFQEQLEDGVPDMERFGKIVPSRFTSFIRFPKSK
jgi:GNAT superfamily N-acetyltransferase